MYEINNSVYCKARRRQRKRELLSLAFDSGLVKKAQKKMLILSLLPLHSNIMLV